VLNVSANQGVLRNDADAENGSLTARVVREPTNGSLSLDSSGSFSYTPNVDFDGTDTFTYTASDGTLTSNTAVVTLVVNAVEQTPTATLSASKDATLYERSDGSASNGSGQFLFTGKTNENVNSLRRALIAFDVAGDLPAGANVTAARLELNMSKSTTGSMDVSLHRVTTDWTQGASDPSGEEGGEQVVAPTQGDATWIHSSFESQLWNNPGGDFDSSPSATTAVDAEGAYVWTSVELLDDVQDWIDNPSENFGWILLTDETTTSAKRFDSRENGTTENEPRLVVEYTIPDTPETPNAPFGDVITGTFEDSNVLGIRTDLQSGAPPISADHVTTAVDYTEYSNPPTYGPHHGFLRDEQGNSVTPRPTGVYETEQPDEDLVHNLEHGHVWISYNPSLISDADLLALEKFVTDGGTDTGVILTPRAANTDAIALASWARLVTLDRFNATPIRNFVEANRGKAPEGYIPSGQKTGDGNSENVSDGLPH
jgi:VCBS repeat-containing protein